MFRMKFQSTVDCSTSSDEEDERTVREDSSGSCSPEPVPEVVVFEGKVGEFEEIRPLPSSVTTFPLSADGHFSLRSMILSPSAQVGPIPSPKPKLAAIDPVILEVPAQEPTDPSPQHATIVLDGESLPPGNDSMTEKTTILTYLHCQDSISGQDSKIMALVEAPCALIKARTASSTSESSECSTPTERNEEEEEDGAVTEMINALLQERMNILQKNDDKFAEPWEEPLLAAHDEQELELLAKEEAKIEAKRLAEEERLERERQLRELRDLAHCATVNAPSLGSSSTFTKSKPKRIWGKTVVIRFYRFVKRPFRIFRSHKKYTAYPDARAAKVVIPKASLFGGCRTVPSSVQITDSQLNVMRNAPQLRMTRQPHIQFATVESTQRDVPAWTREEYLRKNGRIPETSNNKEEDEEFGGIEGNNLMNQYFDDGILTDYDSDSD